MEGIDEVHLMIPKAFFVTSGKAINNVSTLNAFDLALKDASIANCNLVHVSSILPPNCKQIKVAELPVGAITYAVISQAEGENTTLSAGIAWGVDKQKGYGIVAETSGHTSLRTTRKDLEKKILEMAKIRGVELDGFKYKVETLDVPEGSYGCVIAALVYIV